MTIRFAALLFVLGLSALFSLPANAQVFFGEGRRGDRGDRSGGRTARLEGFIRSMDANGNGILEPNEVPENRRGFFAFMVSRAGMSPTEPVPISRLVEGFASPFPGPGGPGSGPFAGPMGAPPPGGGPDGGSANMAAGSGGGPAASPPSSSHAESGPKAGAAPSSPPPPPPVPGFGTGQSIGSVPGFGPVVVTSSAAPPQNAMPGLSSGAGMSAQPGASASVGEEARYRGFAEGILRRYDANQNGVLDREEWGQMRNDPTAADRNQDGQITVDELAAWLVERGRARYGEEHREARQAGASPGDGPAVPGNGARKSYRFLSPKERLPAGLPEWFASRDADGDGQVSMAEFATSWSDQKAREFQDLDTNGDGMITPAECLRGGDSKKPSMEIASGSTGSRDTGPAAGPASGQGTPAPAPAPGGGAQDEKPKPWWMAP